jgi:hypothetical protein
MKILYLDTQYIFKFIPRIEILQNDALIVDLKNEYTKELTEKVNNGFTIDGNYVRIRLDETEINAKHRDKFELSITKNNEVVYLGKILVVNEGTDIQNYKNERAKFQ